VFEQLVRPSQRPNVVPTRRIVSVREVVEVEQSGVTWGKSGTLPDAIEVPAGEDPSDISFTVKKDKEFTLDYGKSTTQKVKVQNPDDPSQYLVEERLKKAVFTDKKPDTAPIYRVGSSNDLQSDRTKTYSPGGSSIETVNPDPGWHTDNAGAQPGADPFIPQVVKNNNYTLIWPETTNVVVVSEKGPDG